MDRPDDMPFNPDDVVCPHRENLPVRAYNGTKVPITTQGNLTVRDFWHAPGKPGKKPIPLIRFKEIDGSFHVKDFQFVRAERYKIGVAFDGLAY